MFFERFDLWGEEKLGLLSGISFVLMGALIYVLYCMNFEILSYIPLALMILSSASIAYLFQLPRLRSTKSGVATLLGGLMIGVTIIFYAIMGAMEKNRDILGQIEIWCIGAAIMILSFFAMGFLLLAVYPEGALSSAEEVEKSKKKKAERKKEKEEIKEKKEKEGEEDFLERIERL